MRTRLLVVVAILCACATTRSSNSLEEMTKAERAFARTCGEIGQRDSWLQWFAPNGVMFSPGPSLAHDVMRARPPAAKPLPTTLYWEPVYGDVASSGELGFNTGPWRIRDNSDQKRPDLHGWFFSIWRKQTTGEWRVALDLGVRVPAPAPAAGDRFGSPFKAALPHEGGAGSFDELVALDERLSLAADFSGHVADDAWALRFNRLPLRGRVEILEALSVGQPVHHRVLGGEISRSRHFAYTYGSYTKADGEKGFYTRVWRTDRVGVWRMVFEVARPDPLPA